MGACVINNHINNHYRREETKATALDIIAEWGLIAQSIARQCRWRPKGQCLVACKGLAVCNLDGLTLVDSLGRPIAP